MTAVLRKSGAKLFIHTTAPFGHAQLKSPTLSRKALKNMVRPYGATYYPLVEIAKANSL